AFGTGATGIFRNPFGARDAAGNPVDPVFAFPTTTGGDAIFSLYPFPNNPSGVYGANTLTQVLPAGGQGKVFSGKLDGSFEIGKRLQTVTARYNFTDDWRDIPATGGAIFSALRSRVRAQNFSFFWNGKVSAPASPGLVFNQARLSYGRTRLKFDELRDPSSMLPSGRLPGTPFLLNAPFVSNVTLPTFNGREILPNAGQVSLVSRAGQTVEQLLGPVGQINMAGFSPVGVDVFNFPQKRVNNTYQVADTLTLRAGNHGFAFGTDNRRTELNSELPRNARPLISFGGVPQIEITSAGTVALTNRFIRPETLAAASAASGFSQTLATGGESGISLRFYQINFFAQDEWRVRSNLSLSFGLRYEYNTPPRETVGRIENTFNDPALALVPGIRTFVGNRSRIYDPDRNNFAPRVGVAWSTDLFGHNRTTVVRGGYGLFYDQILGAVVSQSRNVYPTYLTVDFAGGPANLRFLGCPFANSCPFDFINPGSPLFGTDASGRPVGLVQNGTLNTINPALTLGFVVDFVNFLTGGGGTLPRASGFGMTIPAQRLEMPRAQHYSATLEQQLSRNMVVSAAYVGTTGSHLLRFTTPNLGANAFLVPLSFSVAGGVAGVPSFFGIALPPGSRIDNRTGAITGGRPVNT
ncbi:MAG TPA: hypothetical protein VF507_05550, partial [Pyrinomonadaceae bacterium]